MEEEEEEEEEEVRREIQQGDKINIRPGAPLAAAAAPATTAASWNRFPSVRTWKFHLFSLWPTPAQSTQYMRVAQAKQIVKDSFLFSFFFFLF